MNQFDLKAAGEESRTGGSVTDRRIAGQALNESPDYDCFGTERG